MLIKYKKCYKTYGSFKSQKSVQIYNIILNIGKVIAINMLNGKMCQLFSASLGLFLTFSMLIYSVLRSLLVKKTQIHGQKNTNNPN